MKKILSSSRSLPQIKLRYKIKLKKSELPLITMSEDAYKILEEVWKGLDNINHIESFIVLYMSRSNRVLGWQQVSLGGITGTVADPRIIFQAAILTNAAGIILSHNHPSGNTKPSEADIQLTQKMTQAGKVLDISVLDHLIMTDEGYYSFADEGKL